MEICRDCFSKDKTHLVKRTTVMKMVNLIGPGILRRMTMIVMTLISMMMIRKRLMMRMVVIMMMMRMIMMVIRRKF